MVFRNWREGNAIATACEPLGLPFVVKLRSNKQNLTGRIRIESIVVQAKFDPKQAQIYKYDYREKKVLFRGQDGDPIRWHPWPCPRTCVWVSATWLSSFSLFRRLVNSVAFGVRALLPSWLFVYIDVGDSVKIAPTARKPMISYEVHGCYYGGGLSFQFRGLAFAAPYFKTFLSYK